MLSCRKSTCLFSNSQILVFILLLTVSRVYTSVWLLSTLTYCTSWHTFYQWRLQLPKVIMDRSMQTWYFLFHKLSPKQIEKIMQNSTGLATYCFRGYSRPFERYSATSFGAFHIADGLSMTKHYGCLKFDLTQSGLKVVLNLCDQWLAILTYSVDLAHII